MFASNSSIDASRQIRATGIRGRAKHKRVFDYPMLAHVWAQRTQDDGRSPKGQMYFKGDTIFSYGPHFPIARFCLDGRVVLFNDERRSQTTGRHQNAVRSALRGLDVKVFHVPYVDESVEWNHSRNVAHLLSKLTDHAARMSRAHVSVWFGYEGDERAADTAVKRIATLEPLASEVRDYCAAFGLECPAFDLSTMEKKITEAFARYNDPKRVAKRAAASEAQAAKHWRVAQKVAAFFEGVTDAKPNLHFVSYRVKAAIGAQFGFNSWQLENRIDNLHRQRMNARKPQIKKDVTPTQWQNGQGPAYVGDVFRNGTQETLVRRVGDMLETSRGAECPFKHAVLAFLKAQECRATGTHWKRNGQQIRVGHFQVDSIDTEGNMRAGCHTLQWAEMLRLAVKEVPHLVKPSFGLPALVVS